MTIPYLLTHPTLLVLAIVVGIIATARLTRLVVADEWPPVVWLRMKWDGITHDGPWSKLVHCPFCFAPWAAVPVIAWALLTNFHWTWWLFCGWLTVSYLASIFVYFDEGTN